MQLISDKLEGRVMLFFLLQLKVSNDQKLMQSENQSSTIKTNVGNNQNLIGTQLFPSRWPLSYLNMNMIITLLQSGEDSYKPKDLFSNPDTLFICKLKYHVI